MITSGVPEEDVKKLKAKQKEDRQAELKDIREVMSTDAGKRFFLKTLQFCKTFEDIPDLNANVHRMLGRRSVGLFLMSEIASADISIAQNLHNSHLETITKKEEETE